jgi:nucleotidyltransferase/DNA polymerase involved in DNA repair
MPVSCGVARTKLLARLASPLSKPGGVTVLPDGEALNFLRSQRIRDIPLLR